jgi:hypothetical protein
MKTVFLMHAGAIMFTFGYFLGLDSRQGKSGN